MNRIEIDHTLAPDAIEVRIRELADKHDIQWTVTTPGQAGELTKKVPFLGAVEARYEIGPKTVAIEILKAPGPLKNTLKKMLEDELGQALS